MIAKDYSIKGLIELVGRSLAWQITTLPNLVAISIAEVEMQCFYYLKRKILDDLASICHYCLSLGDKQ